ncbi:hypothetical protein RYZ26_15335 [Terasakiella sp. A23]|uniref:hypothetical protein n=1 Tax=Terasakiella sp. FCG-A23 TaxID=3080561 RepID=UPI002955AD26|nr:hypothetical protein [Terasakiella sp. A23]MDV7340978.1 hypothetical protein [Terasakiella sp. A23]
MPEQFTENVELTAISREYKNEEYTLVADEVLPEQQVDDEKFTYMTYPEAQNFSVPDTRVGRRSAPNRVELEGKEETGRTFDYAIDVPLDNRTIKAAEKRGWDPKAQAVGVSTNIIKLDREVRCHAFVSDPANYSPNLVEALSGSDMFSDPASKPYEAIKDMMRSCLMRPNQLVFGSNIFDTLTVHPQLLKKVGRSINADGVLTEEDLAKLFKVKKVIVGEGRININRPGQNATYHFVWDNIVAGHFIDRTATPQIGGVTFGFTARHGQRIAGTVNVDMGVEGGVLVRAGEYVNEIGVASAAGFLLQNAQASQT